MIQMIEELSLNSWPSVQTLMYDGWVLRFANGFTKRSNSVSPLYGSSLDIEEKIRFCERSFRNKGQTPVFKITPAVFPGNLDKILENKGYIIDSPTSVQTLELNSFAMSPSQKARLSGKYSEKWLKGFCSLSLITGLYNHIKAILINIVPDVCYASLPATETGNIVSYGLGVLQGTYLALYDIVTDRDYRNRGFGREIVLNMLKWGKTRGAKTAYLHVMHDNAPALKLYSNLGFKEIYSYWYRIKE